jgi:hypothetical protein
VADLSLHVISSVYKFVSWPRGTGNNDGALYVGHEFSTKRSLRSAKGSKMKIRYSYALALVLTALTTNTASAFAAGTEAPVAAEINPPGDIPDSQAFIVFTSPGGFTLKVPEGWARKDADTQTIFNDKFNRIAIETSKLAQPLNLAFANSTLAPDLLKSGRAVKIIKVLSQKLKAGEAVRIIYESNSEPNSVTNKQVRDENERFFYAKEATLVTLDLAAPKGADNVDQWKLISSSFRWK